jgi:hypothetical protein
MKIALICAQPAGTNTGMISVDLAFNSLKLENVSVTRFCSWKSISKKEPLGLEYTELNTIDQLETFDKIIYWGDFLHWLEYFQKDWFNKTVNQNSTVTFNEAADTWYQLYLLENRPDLQKKTIIFGNTFYGLNSKALSDSRYLSAIKSLYTNCQISMNRDILSTNFVKQLTNGNTEFGCDCSLLLDSLEYGIDSTIDQDYFLYSFGRSGENELLINFVNDLGKKIKKTPIELKWLTKGTGVGNLIECLKKIKKSSFVITDIYHCAVNSNRENIKTICVGNGSSRVTDTLSDKKKEIFYRQHFQDRNYFYTEAIKKNYEEELDRIVEILDDTNSFDIGFDFLNNHIKKIKEKITDEILR